VQDILSKEKEVPAKKLLFFPNGVDTGIFAPQEKDLQLAAKLGLSGKKVLIYPGNHGYAHALHRVLEAADLLQKKGDSKWHFLLVGGGSEKERLQQMAKDLQLKNVTFHPPVLPKDLAPLIALADIGLVHVRNSPLASETRPAKMFPLMAMRKPILFAGFGEGAELLRQLDAGVVTKVEDPEDLLRGMEQMDQDPQATLRMGNNGYLYVTEKMSFRAITRRWLEQLQERLK